MKKPYVLAIAIFATAMTAPAESADRQIITTSITVDVGDTLRIPPGKELLFGNLTGITVRGHLLATGTAEQPIVFASVNDTTETENAASPFDWNGIDIVGPGSADFAYSLITSATSGITAERPNSVNLANGIFKNNGQWNLSINGEILNVPDGQPYTYSTPPAIPTPAEFIAANTTSAQPAKPKTAAGQGRGNSHKWIKWTLYGTGGAAAIGGVTSLIIANSIANEYNAYVPGNKGFDKASPTKRQNHYNYLRDNYNTSQTIGWSLIGLAAVDGIYLTFFF